MEWYEYGCVLQELDRNEEAVAALQQAISREPRAAAFHYRLARALWALGRFDEAEAAYRRAVRHDSGHITASRELVELLLLRRRWNEAEEAARSLFAYDQSAESAHTLGSVLMINGRPAEAEKFFRGAAQMQPDSLEMQADLGESLAQQQKFDEAEELLARLVQSTSTDYYPYFILSRIQLARNLPDSALTSAMKARDLAPTTAQPYIAVGAAQLGRGDAAAAITAFTRGLEFAPDDPDMLAGLGCALSTAGRHTEALQSFERVLRAEPEYFSRDASAAQHFDASRQAQSRSS